MAIFLTEEIEENIFFDYIDLANKKVNKRHNLTTDLEPNKPEKKVKKSNHQKMKIKEDDNFNNEQ